ncbi:dihydro-6-hydroxymethylpterin pyrophosphokinase (HPPK), putative, partial [Acanthamoeba castellanii str. Neff]
MPAKDKIFIKDLMVQAILGVNKEERVKRQNINISIVIFHDIKQAALHDDVRHTINYSLVCKAVVAYTEDSHHYTLESLCSGIAKICCVQFGAAEAIVHVEKPCALSLARCPAVEVHRTRDFFL